MACFRGLRHVRVTVSGQRYLADFLHILGDALLAAADNVSDDDHLRVDPSSALWCIVNRMKITIIEMLKTGKHHALGLGLKELRNLINSRTRVACRSVELQAYGLSERGHLVHDKSGGCDNAVAAFFLQSGNSAKEFIRHVLAQARLTDCAAFDPISPAANLGGFLRRASAFFPNSLENHIFL